MANDELIRTGVSAASCYTPWFKLTSEEIARSQRKSNARQSAQRRLAGFDEDALTMAVAAARLLSPELLDGVDTLIFTTTTPPYLVKNNASAAHAALGLAANTAAYDFGGSLRSFSGGLLVARPGTLLLCADINVSRPGAASELGHGDAAAALVLGAVEDAIAEVVTSVSVTDEMLDQWRLAEQPWISTSEDRFPVSRMGPLLDDVLAQLSIDRFEHVIVSAPSTRVEQMAVKRVSRLGPINSSAMVGYAGSADLAVQLCRVLSGANPGDLILALNLSDGCDLVVLRCTDLLASRRPTFSRSDEDGQVPTYHDALTWRGLLKREPPRRPEPSPVSPSVSGRRVGWKYGLRGSRCAACDAVATPPQRVCVRCGSLETHEQVDLSRKSATIRTFSIDRLAYSPNPPMIAAIIDFDGGGRLEVEMTDTLPESLAVGQRVQMSFRLRHSSGGIHNYAWKAIPQQQKEHADG